MATLDEHRAKLAEQLAEGVARGLKTVSLRRQLQGYIRQHSLPLVVVLAVNGDLTIQDTLDPPE